MTIHEIERKIYLKDLEAFRDKTDYVKVITGVRRCGKSTLMNQFMRYLVSTGVPQDHIIHLNMESSEMMGITDAVSFSDHLMKLIPKDKERSYVLLDEVQRVSEWERSVNALMVDTDADIYITGSNSKLLSSELTTYLTGRYVRINMFPLSFSEFYEFHNGSGKDTRELFELYMKYGGFPGIDPTDGDDVVRSSLRDLYSSIVLWDVVSRGNVKNIQEFDRLMRYMMINVGNPISIRSIASNMNDIHRETVDRYIGLMEDAYILYRADRYDLKGTALQPSPKYYCVDHGLRNMALDYDLSDIGRIMESIVYLELLRRGARVTVGKWDAKEIDFVAVYNDGNKAYYQVCYDINLEDTKEREFSPLRGIKDSFPKNVLVMHPYTGYVTHDGINVINIMDWLLK